MSSIGQFIFWFTFQKVDRFLFGRQSPVPIEKVGEVRTEVALLADVGARRQELRL